MSIWGEIISGRRRAFWRETVGLFFATVVRFSKVPQLFWSFLGAKIPFMFSQRRGSKSSKQSSWFFLQ